MTWTIKPSRYVNGFIVLFNLLAFIAIVHNSLPIFIKFFLFVILWIYQSIERKKTFLKQLHFSQERGWQIADNHLYQNIQILNSTVILTWIIFLHIQYNVSKQKRYFMILPDSLEKQDFRRLIVHLKIYP